MLSPEEVTRLIDAACNLHHRTLLMTLYSTAVRRAELCQLKVHAFVGTNPQNEANFVYCPSLGVP